MYGLRWKGNQDVEQCFPWKFSFSISAYICFQKFLKQLISITYSISSGNEQNGKVTYFLESQPELSQTHFPFWLFQFLLLPFQNKSINRKTPFFYQQTNSFNPSFITLCLGPTSLFFTFVIFNYNKASRKLPITKMYCWHLLCLLLLLLAVNMNQFKLFKSGT